MGSDKAVAGGACTCPPLGGVRCLDALRISGLSASLQGSSNGFCNGHMPRPGGYLYFAAALTLVAPSVCAPGPEPVAAPRGRTWYPQPAARAWCLLLALVLGACALCLSAGIYWPRFDTWACCELSLGGFNASSRVSSFLPLLPSFATIQDPRPKTRLCEVFVRPLRRPSPTADRTGVSCCPAARGHPLGAPCIDPLAARWRSARLRTPRFPPIRTWCLNFYAAAKLP